MMTRLALVTALLAAILFGSSVHANMAPPVEAFHLGLKLESIRTGARVLQVEKGLAADKMGVRAGDIILAIDRRYARSFSKADLKAFQDEEHVWPLELIVVRDGRDVIELRGGR